MRFELDLEFDQTFAQQVVGVDEVGRGCLAGPLVVGAVILDITKLRTSELSRNIRDSKKLTPSTRAKLRKHIEKISIWWRTEAVEPCEIDRLGIRTATLRSMARLVSESPAEFALLDGRDEVAGIRIPQKAMIGGDDLSPSIAAASIIAKEWRDDWMRTVAARNYPVYGFEQHVGYGTKQHLAALEEFGPCPLHRRSFAPVARAWERTASHRLSNEQDGRSRRETSADEDSKSISSRDMER